MTIEGAAGRVVVWSCLEDVIVVYRRARLGEDRARAVVRDMLSLAIFPVVAASVYVCVDDYAALAALACAVMGTRKPWALSRHDSAWVACVRVCLRAPPWHTDFRKALVVEVAG